MYAEAACQALRSHIAEVCQTRNRKKSVPNELGGQTQHLGMCSLCTRKYMSDLARVRFYACYQGIDTIGWVFVINKLTSSLIHAFSISPSIELICRFMVLQLIKNGDK